MLQHVAYRAGLTAWCVQIVVAHLKTKGVLFSYDRQNIIDKPVRMKE